MASSGSEGPLGPGGMGRSRRLGWDWVGSRALDPSGVERSDVGRGVGDGVGDPSPGCQEGGQAQDPGPRIEGDQD